MMNCINVSSGCSPMATKRNCLNKEKVSTWDCMMHCNSAPVAKWRSLIRGGRRRQVRSSDVVPSLWWKEHWMSHLSSIKLSVHQLSIIPTKAYKRWKIYLWNLSHSLELLRGSRESSNRQPKPSRCNQLRKLMKRTQAKWLMEYRS